MSRFAEDSFYLRERDVIKTRPWLALLLLLHVVVHPLLHEVPLRGVVSGPDSLSAAVAGNHSQSYDCDLCRAAQSIVPTADLTIPTPCDSSSPVATCPESGVFGGTRFQLSARAPPTY